MESYTDTLEWIHEYTQQTEKQRLEEVKSISSFTEREKEIRAIKGRLKKFKTHYESILISSTIWSLQYLLALELDRIGDIHKIDALFEHPSFAKGGIGSKARVPQHRKVFHKLLFIKTVNPIKEQLENIYIYASEE